MGWSRAKVWTVAIVVGTGLFLGWRLKRPAPLIEFIGERPPAEFVFKDELGLKAVIDVRLPLLGRVQIPRPRYLWTRATPEAYCGYLEWKSKGPETITLQTGTVKDEIFDRVLSDEPYKWGVPFGKEVGRLLPLPYATDEKYRDATLIDGVARWKIKLPVDHSQGPAQRKATSFQAGPYTVKVEPEPWPLTTSPFVLGLSADLPPGKKLLVQVFWLRGPKGDPENVFGGWLIEGKAKTYVPIERTFSGITAKGEVHELVEFAREKVLYNRRADKRWGELLDEVELHKPPASGHVIVDGMGILASSIKGVLRSKLDHEDLYIRYRVRSKWGFSFDLDRPPAVDEINIDQLLLRWPRGGHVRSSYVFNPETGDFDR